MWLLKSILVLCSLLLLVLGAGCKRMEKPQEDTSKPSGKQLGTAAARPELPDQDNIAPGQVQVELQVVDVSPVLDASATGPCRQSPCWAEVLVKKITGYGSGFTASIAQGQRVKVYFPMSLQASEDRPAVQVGTNLDARLSQSVNGGTDFVMRRFTIRP